MRERLEELRPSVPLQRIVDATGGAVSLNEILNVLECKKVEYSVYKELAEALKNFPE